VENINAATTKLASFVKVASRQEKFAATVLERMFTKSSVKLKAKWTDIAQTDLRNNHKI